MKEPGFKTIGDGVFQFLTEDPDGLFELLSSQCGRITNLFSRAATLGCSVTIRRLCVTHDGDFVTSRHLRPVSRVTRRCHG